MRINFRQGIVSAQSGGFLSLVSGNVNLLANNRPLTLTVAHRNTNYTHIENSTVVGAWSGPFLPTVDYWLFWDFDLLTFERTFGVTTLEPVAQSAEPGNGNAPITGFIPGGSPGVGAFIVPEFYALPKGRVFSVINSVDNDGNYTVDSTSFNQFTGETTIFVEENVIATTGSPVLGELTLDLDSNGNPLLQVGRHWFDTVTNRHFIRQSDGWAEVLRVFAAQVRSGNTFIPQTITGGSFFGTQIGNTFSVRSGRVLFDESSDTIRRDDRTFFTTEDQFFASASRVDAIRLESNVARAQFPNDPAIAEFSVVAWVGDGKAQTAQYEDIGTTVLGVLTENVLINEVGAVIIQGVVTNPSWDWLSETTVGAPLWVDNGELVSVDPHTVSVIDHPKKQVPIARVLDTNTVVFEQGLGGVGPTGPTGSVDDLPPATNSVPLGGVLLSLAPANPNLPIAVGDNDPRMTDTRDPNPHMQAATTITVTPSGGISSNNTQDALVELDSEKLNVTGGTMSGDLDMGSNQIINLADGTDSNDAVNLGQLQTAQAGITVKGQSRVATTADLDTETGDTWTAAGGPGVGKTLTSSANTATIDGEALVNGDRVLVKDQSTASDNGIYVVSGVGGAAVVLTRTSDYDGTPDNEVAAGTFTFIEEGTTNGSTGWALSKTGLTGGGNPVRAVVDTDPLTFVKFQSLPSNIRIEDLDDVTAVTTPGGGQDADNSFLVFDIVSDTYESQTPAQARTALDVFSTSEVTGSFASLVGSPGVVPDSQISESSVTQHESALTITESQISDLGDYVNVIGDTMTGFLSLVTGSPAAPQTPTLDEHAVNKKYVDDQVATASLPTPVTACNVLAVSEGSPLAFTERAVPELSTPYDIAAQVFGTPPDDETVMKFVSPQKLIIFDYGHQGDAVRTSTLPDNTPDATTRFRVFRNTAQIGELGFFQEGGEAKFSADVGVLGGWPNGNGDFIGSFITVDVGDFIAIKSPTPTASGNIEDIALTLRGIIEPAVPCGTIGVSFDKNAAADEFYLEGTDTIGMTFSGSITHAEWAVLGYTFDAQFPPTNTGSPLSTIIPLGDDFGGVGGTGRTLTFDVPGVGTTVFTTNQQYEETGTLAAPDITTFSDGANSDYYLIRCTVFGPAGVATDVAWVKPI